MGLGWSGFEFEISDAGKYSLFGWGGGASSGIREKLWKCTSTNRKGNCNREQFGAAPVEVVDKEYLMDFLHMFFDPSAVSL